MTTPSLHEPALAALDRLSTPRRPLCVLILAAQDQAQVWFDLIRRRRSDAAIQIETDYLMALGAATTSRPPDLVIASHHLMGAHTLSAAHAWRRLAPKAQRVLIDNTSDDDLAGFDRKLTEPIDENALADLVDACAEAISTPPSSDAQDVAATADLGDVDLVEIMLHDHQRLPAVALRLIAAQSQIADLAFAPDQKEIPTHHRRAAVMRDKQTFGYLHAPPPAAIAQLQPWAQWLSHWSALQRRMDELWRMALRDELTGVWNRRYFNRFLDKVLQRAAHDRFRVTLLVFDIDDFKHYNDKYGHVAGDDILCETARMMQSAVREHDVVARIGGDEFAVIFWDADAPRQQGSEHPHSVRLIADRFRKALCDHQFPKLMEEALGALSVSAGLAGFPWDGANSCDLMAKADEMAMLSKKQGKNAFTFGPGALQMCRISEDDVKPSNS